MREIPNHPLLHLTRLSPSQLVRLRVCAGQLVLGQAYRGVKIMTPSPATVFGTAIHKLLELATSGAFANRKSIEESLASQLRLAEDKLQDDGFAYLIPLRYRIQNFAIKCTLAVDRAEILRSRRWGGTGKATTLTEQWLLSANGQMGGIVDAIAKRGDYVQLLDYKSGNIFEDATTGQLKEAYEVQLKLYAQLYFDNHGFYPNQLTVIDLEGHSVDVNFSEEECQTIYNQGIADLNRVNQVLMIDPASLFTPAPYHCRWCEVRAVCDYYSPEIKGIGQSTDIIGKLTDVTSRPLGLTAKVNVLSTPITIIGIPTTNEIDWPSLVGQSVRFFGIRCIAENRYGWQNETTGWYERRTNV